MATLLDIFKGNIGVGPFTLQGFSPRTQVLPNSGGLFSTMVPSQAKATPTPAPVVPAATTAPVVKQAPVVAPAPAVTTPPPVDLYAKYRDPKTGNIMSPEEYAIYLGNRVPKPKGTGDVPQYAGSALEAPDVSATDLITQATKLNNARNDIATGATDPYKVGAKSGIAYSPTELAAIEKAYAGIYDPALNDVFARLKTKQAEEQRLQDREDKIFATNESIRAWKATTGSKSSSDDSIFTNDNIKAGASRANLTPEQFKTLDPAIKNYFVNPPKVYDPATDTTSLVSENMAALKKEIEDGVTTPEEGAQEIMDGDLPEEVKLYLIGQLPKATEVQKQGWFSQILSGIWNVVNPIK